MGVKLAAASGGSIELVPTNTASNFTVTVPAVTATMLTTVTAGVPINGPAFRAYLPTVNQSITAGVNTKVALSAETFDTNNNFDSTTNYRFTPTVAGYYFVHGIIFHSSLGTRPSTAQTMIYKNGTLAASSTLNIATANQVVVSVEVSSMFSMNGSTDYLELYGIQTGGSSNLFGLGETATFFEACLVRSA